jgi:NitT/TauT family transport system substrate-binding protein
MTKSVVAALAAVLLAFGLFPQTSARAGDLELTHIKLAVGGAPSLFYLPLAVTDRLGYFKDEGLDVQISDFQGGAKSLQAMIGGSADVVAGAYDHTIQMAAKKQPITAVVELGQFPGFVLVGVKDKLKNYKSPADLKGLKIGVSAPGSSTHFMVLYMMAKAGLKPSDASFLGVGTSSTAVAAVKRGEIDALVAVDPVVNLLQSEGLITILADTRTLKGATDVYGGPVPAAVLYVPAAFPEKNPNTTQALVNAFVRGLKWMHSHSAADIVKLMPPEWALGNPGIYEKSIASGLPTYSPDGRFAPGTPENVLKVLKEFDANVQKASIDLGKTYTNAFVDKALAAKK